MRANKKTGRNDPPFTVKDYKRNRKASKVFIEGPATLVYQPCCPLSCGAIAWIETESEVTTL